MTGRRWIELVIALALGVWIYRSLPWRHANHEHLTKPTSIQAVLLGGSLGEVL